MSFEQPIWLILLLPAALGLMLWPSATRWLRVCRALIYSAVIAALAHPFIRLPDRAGTIVVVADRSLSLPATAPQAQREVIQTLQQTMRARDRLAVVAFGEKAAVERPPQQGPFAGFNAEVGDDLSNLDQGLEAALALIPPDSPGRLLILSDGRWTGRDPSSIASRAAERQIAIDYRLHARPQVNEVSIQRWETPSTLAPEQACFLNAWIESPTEQEVRYQLVRGTTILAAGNRNLVPGLNRLMFRDRAPADGTLTYRLSVTTAGNDPCPENNHARALVTVLAPRRILTVSEAGSASGLARLLKRGGLPVAERRPAECVWTIEELSQFSAVLLENVLANPIGHTGMENLAAWVEQTGAGLMMTGGRKSYGPGGYYRSPLERILPVSLEMRQEHRKSRIAIVVTLDRSGSMAVSAGGGRTKMDLANLGTAQVLDMLMPGDEFGVIAVDSRAHVIVELDTASKVASERNRILSIDSRGGGIFIYEALSTAARMLLNAQAENKHIILFADAADSEEPGAYRELIAHCRQANITVSVVGLGTAQDVDAPLLEEIGKLGDGNCFFTASPDEIPRLFAQDTFSVTRSTFVEEPTPFKFTAGISALGGQFTWQPPSLGGYNLCYLRPDATLAAVTTDEYSAPVVAQWQAGQGRVLCFTGEADGSYSGPFAEWSQAGEYYTSLARWTAGDVEPPVDDVVITQEVRDGACRIDLHLDPRRSREPFAEPPAARMMRGVARQPSSTTSHRFEWVSADMLQLNVPIRGQETLLPILQWPQRRPMTLAPVCLPYSPEYQPDLTGRGAATLRRMAATTGGEERLDLGSMWKTLPSKRRQVLLTPWLAVISLTLFLIEILERRTGQISRWIPLRFARRTSGAVSPSTPNIAVPHPPSAAVLSAPPRALATPANEPTPAPQPAQPPPRTGESTHWNDLQHARRRAQERRRPGE